MRYWHLPRGVAVDVGALHRSVEIGLYGLSVDFDRARGVFYSTAIVANVY